MKCWYMLQVDEPWKHDGKWKKPDIESHMSYDSINIKYSENGKSISQNVDEWLPGAGRRGEENDY